MWVVLLAVLGLPVLFLLGGLLLETLAPSRVCDACDSADQVLDDSGGCLAIF
jgi:hypothetical protein